MVWGVMREFEAATWVAAGRDGLEGIPERGAALLLVCADDGALLNFERTQLQARQLRVVIFVEPAEAAGFRRAAPDLVDWVRATVSIPEGPPPYAVAAVREASEAGAPLTWSGSWAREAVEATGRRVAELGADTPIEGFRGVGGVDAVIIRGSDTEGQRYRASVCLTEVGFQGLRVYEGARPGAAVDTRARALAEVQALLRGLGAGRAAALLALATAGEPRRVDGLAAWLVARPAEARALADAPPVDAELQRAAALGALRPAPSPPVLEVLSLAAPGARAWAAWTLLLHRMTVDARRLLGDPEQGAAGGAGDLAAASALLGAREAWDREGAVEGERRLRLLEAQWSEGPAAAWRELAWARWLEAEGRDAEAVVHHRAARRCAPEFTAGTGVDDAEAWSYVRLPAEEALTVAERSLAAGGHGARERVELLTRRAMHLNDLGRWEEGREAAERALEALAGDDDAYTRALALWPRFFAEVMLGASAAPATLARLSGGDGVLAALHALGMAVPLLRHGREADLRGLLLTHVVPALREPGFWERLDVGTARLLVDAAQASGLVDEVVDTFPPDAGRPREDGARHGAKPSGDRGWAPVRAVAQAALRYESGEDPRAREILRALDPAGLDPALRLWVGELLRDLAERAGDPLEARRVEEEVVGPSLPSEPVAWLDHLGRLARYLDLAGDLAGAERMIRSQVLPYAERWANDEQVARVRGSLGLLVLRQGRPGDALDLLNEELLAQLPEEERAPFVLARGLALGALGRLPAAEAALDLVSSKGGSLGAAAAAARASLRSERNGPESTD